MPKQNHVIPQFYGGLVLDIAKEDLPDGVLTNNTRNVHTGKSGHLIGFRDRSQYLGQSEAHEPFHAGTFNDDGVEKLFHLEPTSTPRIRSYNQGSTTVDTKEFPSGVTVDKEKTSHAQRLNHLFIGTGRRSTDKPLWYGKHNHPQFGNNAPSDYQVLPSQLLSPTQLSSSNSFPLGTDAINMGSFTYMISKDSPYIFKFSGYSLIERSEVPFNTLSAIYPDTENGFFWVYERGTQSLYRVNESLEVVSSLFIEGLPNDGKVVSCIAVANNKIYLQRTDPFETDYVEPQNWLYRVSRITGNTSVNAVNESRTGFHQQALRSFESTDEYTTSEILNVYFQMGKKALTVISGELYAFIRFRVDLEVDIFDDSDPDQIIEENRILTQYDNFTAPGEPDPTNVSQTGSVFLGKIGDVDGKTEFNAGDINLYIGNRNILRINDIFASATVLNLFNLDFNGEVQRIRTDVSEITGNTHLPLTIDEVSGFTSANITPVFSFGAGIVKWFSANSPARIGSLTDTTVGNVTESIADISLEKIPGGFSQENRSYHYAFSFIYDGYMESPLSDSVSGTAEEGFGFSLKIQIPQENINRRVTGMNVYRAEGSASGREEFFRLVDYVSFESPVPTDTIDSEPVYIIEYNDRKKMFEMGPAYTSNSGIPEQMKNTLPHYGLSVELDDFLFIADCWHPEVDQAEFMLFRSQPFSFSSFNWEVDVMRLEGKPTALATFNSRIIVFDKNNMYVINPTNLTIEETFKGVGAINNHCVRTTDAGLLVAGNDHMRLFDGQSIQNLSERITLHPGADLSAYSNNPAENTSNALRDYRYLVENGSNIFVVENKSDKTIAVFGRIGSDTIGYIYDLEMDFWSRMVKTSYSFDYALALNTGELLVYKSASVDKLFGSHLDTSVIPIVAELSPFEAEDQNIDKWFYEIRLDYLGNEGSVNVKIATDDNNYSSNLTESPKGIFTISDGVYRKGKKLKIKITGTAKIRSLSIIFRPKQVRS